MDLRLLPYKQLLLALILACLTFPSYNLTYSSGIDEPLVWAFNYFADGHFSAGQHIIFPHGPLAFLLYPLPMGNNTVAAVAITIACSILFSLAVLKLCKLCGQTNEWLTSLVLIFMLASADLQVLIIGLTLTNTLLYHLSRKKTHLAAAVFFFVLALFIKSYVGIICGIIIAGECVYLVYQTKKITASLSVLGGAMVLMIGCWLALYHNLAGLPTFVMGQFQLAFDNSEAVSLMMPNNWLILGLSLMALVTIPFLTKNRFIRFYFVIMAIPFFAAWKHAMGRQDDVHVLGFLNLLVFFFCLFFLVMTEKKRSMLILSLLSMGLFSLNLGINSSIEQNKITLARPFNLFILLTKYDSLQVEKNTESKNNISKKILPDTVLKLIRKSSVDVYPWNYSIIAANRLNWKPRPVIHSYATYTHWLDEKNATHWQSAAAADYVIWELNAFYDHASTMLGIDGHYLLNEAPQSLLSFYKNYDLVYTANDLLLYKKRLRPALIHKSNAAPARQVSFKEWVNTPEAKYNNITRAKVIIKKTIWGKIKSLLYKGEEFYITYFLANGKTHQFRIVPKNAADGIWINPLVLNPETPGTSALVKKIMITCSNPALVNQKFRLQFEYVQFEKQRKSGYTYEGTFPQQAVK